MQTITVYPIAWLKMSKLFSEYGHLAIPLNSWYERVQAVFLEMAEAGIVSIKGGFVTRKRRLPKQFKEQVSKYA